MSEGNNFRCSDSSREYTINSRFNCDSSGLGYVFYCKVCCQQYIVSTFTPFRIRFDKYKSSRKKFSSGISVIHEELFIHFTEDNDHGFLEDVSVQIIDRVFGDFRLTEGF